jgi:hypothetical protein
MHCGEMRELEASIDTYAERRLTARLPERERRKKPTEARRIRLFRADYLIRSHLKKCSVCQVSPSASHK